MPTTKDHRMKPSEVRSFLAQFKNADKRIAEWPKWMREAAHVATARFPKGKS